MAQKITKTQWAGLKNGPIQSISENGCSLQYFPEYGMFVFTRPTGKHTLHVDATDHVRLNAHWQGFVPAV